MSMTEGEMHFDILLTGVQKYNVNAHIVFDLANSLLEIHHIAVHAQM